MLSMERKEIIKKAQEGAALGGETEGGCVVVKLFCNICG